MNRQNKSREYYYDGGILFVKCCVCGEFKPSECFSKSSSGALKLQSRCKECQSKYRKIYNVEHSTRKTPIQEIKAVDGIEYINCVHCGEFKTREEFSIATKSKFGVQSWCKECVLAQSKTEKSKERQREYYLENREKIIQYHKTNRDLFRERRKDKKKEWAKKYYKENREVVNEKNRNRRREKGYGYLHDKTAKYIRERGLRPELCSICGDEGQIEAHHPSYDKWNEVIFCCAKCHRRIHNGIVDIDVKDYITDLLSYK